MGPIIAVAGGGIYWALMYFKPTNALVVGAALTILLIAVYSPWACLPSYICERFQTGVRTAGALAGPETKDVDFAPSAEREVVHT